jgi:predicted pyridoxine 5'-phosphate oxidase superfamily flavin-nucleotide-binding protein
MLSSRHLGGGAARFLRDRDFAVISALDSAGSLWISPLFARPGFLDPGDTTLRIHATPSPGDPLHGLPPGQAIGILVIEFATRRRVRVNGTLVTVRPDELDVDVDQAYGNCPQYIQRRDLRHDEDLLGPAVDRTRWTSLQPEHAALITGADTFFLGTEHPASGADASHRGGAPGFVRVDDPGLWWPDYPGNNMFNSLGNLTVNPAAALLFVDFGTGGTLHLTGTATVEWIESGVAGDDAGTGRRVRFVPRAIVQGAAPHLHACEVEPSRYNPPLT